MLCKWIRAGLLRAERRGRIRLVPDDEVERFSIPDGVFMSAPLVETEEAPEALPRVDDDDQSGTSDERPLNPHVHEVPDR